MDEVQVTKSDLFPFVLIWRPLQMQLEQKK